MFEKRKIIMSDIHGCYDEFRNFLKELNFNEKEDILYVLGDYVDRGPDSFYVINYLLNLKNENPDFRYLLGNHDDWFLQFLDDNLKEYELLQWFMQGGYETLLSYLNEMDKNFVGDILEDFNSSNYKDFLHYLTYGGLNEIYQFLNFEDVLIHLDSNLGKNFSKEFFDNLQLCSDLIKHFYIGHYEFLKNLELFCEDEVFYYAHGGCNPNLNSFYDNSKNDLIWPNRKEFYNSKLNLNKPIVVGHTVTSLINPNNEKDVYFSPDGDKIGIDGGIVFGNCMISLIIDKDGSVYRALLGEDI